MLVPSSNEGRDVEIGGTKLPLISPLLKGGLTVGLGMKLSGKLFGPLPLTITVGSWLDPYEFSGKAV